MDQVSNQHKRNPWNYKPWWCQPWSILLTGITLIFGSWFLLGKIWITAVFGFFICLWWIYFLILWPKIINSYAIENLGAIPSENIPRQKKE